MWTIIEDNTAIICACLPMCKRLLSALIPCLSFEGHHNLKNQPPHPPSGRSGQRSGDRSGDRSGERPDEGSGWKNHRWTYFFDGHASKDHKALMLDPRRAFSHSQVKTGSSQSEEYIMTPMPDARRSETPGSHAEEGGAIRKVTRYEVAYDDAPMPGTKL